MRLALLVVSALLFLMMAPTDAPALKLGRVLGPFAGPVGVLLRGGPRRAGRPYAHRSRARAARYPAAYPPAIAQAQPEAQLGLAARDQAAQPEAFWPGAPRDIFDYVLSSKETGLWANGYGAIVVSVFAQPAAKITSGRGDAGLAASDKIEPTTGAGSTEQAEHSCGERTANRADAVTEQLRGLLALADDQQGVLAELRSALLKTDEEIAAACSRGTLSTLPDRLEAMQDRLWTMRVATTNLRAPLQKFYEALTNEQKAKLDAQPPSERESKGGEANAPAGMCFAWALRAPPWPADQIARAVRPSKDQQVSLRALSELSSQMGQLMMGSCPQKTTVTPLARLDVTLDRLDAMFFGTVNMMGALNDFYRSLSDGQKTKLDTLSL
jgi:LTXXQ motif family protein